MRRIEEKTERTFTRAEINDSILVGNLSRWEQLRQIGPETFIKVPTLLSDDVECLELEEFILIEKHKYEGANEAARRGALMLCELLSTASEAVAREEEKELKEKGK